MSYQNKCIVLDLDETLIHTYSKKDITDVQGYKYLNDNISMRGRLYRLDFGSSDIGYMWSLKRPGVDAFLRYVMSNFGTVIVWSAGTAHYVEKVVEWLFTPLGTYPDAVFSREYCETITVGTHKGSLTKPISKLTKERTGDIYNRINYNNCFFVDDNTISTSYNASNAITIPKFHPEPNLKSMASEDDTSLYQLIAWLETSSTKTSQDIRLLTKPVFTPRMKTAGLLESVFIVPNYQSITV